MTIRGDMTTPEAPRDWTFHETLDTQDMACGDALLELKLCLGGLRPEECLLVTSRDVGAPAEIPAWCRLTGHRLLEARPPFYLIERKTPE
jgi:tRNA 2-thiouridine synthesizing protein A